MKNYKTIIAVLIIAICALVFNYVKAIQITPDEMQSLMGGNLGAIVFNSSQVGKTPANGEILQTDGSSSTWVATSTLGIAAYAAWGAITGTLSSQADLQAELDAKLANSDYYASTTPEHITSLPSSSYIALTDLSATNPITYNNGTGAIGINTADTSTTGALTSTDWNTFNNKLSSVALTDISLAKGNFIVGDDAGVSQATSSIFISSDGNVGIGTAGPTEKLEVAGGNIFLSGSSNKYIMFKTLSNWDYYLKGEGDNFRIYDSQSTDFLKLFYNGGGTNKYASILGTLTVKNTGNVGIGTAAPSGKLDVYLNVGWYTRVDAVGALKSKTNDNTIYNNITLENTRAGANYGAGALFNLGYGGLASVAGTTIAGGKISVAEEQEWTSTASTQDSYMSFKTTLDGEITERMRITSDGNVGIGTISPIYKLDVYGDGRFENDLIANNLSGTNTGDNTVSGTLLDLTGDTLSVNEGTLTDTKYCTYETGTGIQCTSEGGSSSFTSIATLNALLTGETVASTTASNLNFVNDAGYTTNTGDVTKVGTPLNSQIGVWTGDGTIEGTTGLTYDGSNLLLTGDIGVTGTRITKGWFTDLTVTNAIDGSITGNAGTVSTITGLAPDTATTQATQPNITSLGTLTALTVDNINLNGPTISATGDAGLHLYDNASNGLTVLDGGNVGIGTTSPTQALDVIGKISLNDGGNSVFVGEGAGLNDDGTDNRNVGVGYASLYSNTTGSYNTANGMYSLYSNTTGNHNTANGYQSLYSNTTGNHNTANGYYSLFSNTTGSYNTANGYLSLYLNTTGIYNTANGYYSLFSNTTGSYNTANGYYSLFSNTTGSSNTANGYYSLYYNTTGNYNLGLGYNSGRYIADGSTPNETGSNNTFIGANTKALADGDTNEMVIGNDAVGLGSNTVVLGNDSVVITALKGNVGIGTTTPSEVLSVAGNVLADSYIEYSPRYAGDALSVIKDIKCESNTINGDWCKIDHNTLPDGVRYENEYEVSKKVGEETIEHEAVYEEKVIEEESLSTEKLGATEMVLVKEAYTEVVPIMATSTETFVGRDLGKSVQFNLKAIQELLEKVEAQDERIKTLESQLSDTKLGVSNEPFNQEDMSILRRIINFFKSLL